MRVRAENRRTARGGPGIRLGLRGCGGNLAFFKGGGCNSNVLETLPLIPRLKGEALTCNLWFERGAVAPGLECLLFSSYYSSNRAFTSSLNLHPRAPAISLTCSTFSALGIATTLGLDIQALQTSPLKAGRTHNFRALRLLNLFVVLYAKGGWGWLHLWVKCLEG